jgi:hypothetical protein
MVVPENVESFKYKTQTFWEQENEIVARNGGWWIPI